MDQRQNHRSDMFNAVQHFMDANTDIWSGIPALVTFKNQFDEQLIQIRGHQDNQEAAKVYLGKNKITQKQFVSEKADILNDALGAYAAVEEKAELILKASKSFSDLYRRRNQDFITVITETITLLEEHMDGLADYGVTTDQITDLKNSFDRFLEINGQPRQYRIAERQATIGLSELFEQTATLLSDKMDKVMKRFKRANTTFYVGYQAARVIVGK